MKRMNQGGPLLEKGPYVAKYCLPMRFDEMPTETNEGDIVRCLRKQIEE